LAEYVLLVAFVVVGLVGVLFGTQSNLRKIFTKATTQMGIADCATSGSSCPIAGSDGGTVGSSGGSGSSAAASSSGGTGGSGSGSSGSGSSGIVLGAGDETPTSGPSVSTGSGGGTGGSQPQPGLRIPTQAASP
jgi:Flp pilus assembly pilin Flp